MRKYISVAFLILISVLIVLFIFSRRTEVNRHEPVPSPDFIEELPDTAAESHRLALKEDLSELWSRISGTAAMSRLTTALYKEIDGGFLPPFVVDNTADAYRRLIEHNPSDIYSSPSDLIFVTYPSEIDFISARVRGIELDLIPVAMDALVFMVNADNPIDNIALTDLRDIYSGKITNWAEIGGSDEEISAFQRTDLSAGQVLFNKLLMNGAEPMKPLSGFMTRDSGQVIESMLTYDNSKGAIGFSQFYYIENMFGSSRFKLLGINGIVPTRETIADGTYTLGDYFYAVMRKDTPQNSDARILVDWLISKDGQKLVAQNGHIPLSPVEFEVSGEAVNPVFSGDTENSSGTGGAASEICAYDCDCIIEEPLFLSDVFFDGFNYINYINSVIVGTLNIMGPERGAFPADEDWQWFYRGYYEHLLLRPFTGIPNDYPHFTFLDDGRMYILFPFDNPFFPGRRDFIIPLTADISPYA